MKGNGELKEEHTMMTFSAFSKDSTTSSMLVLVIAPSILCSLSAAGAIPPKRTLVRDLFMAVHFTHISLRIIIGRVGGLTMMYDRIEPLTPINAPTVVRRGLSSMNPSATKANPE